MMETTIDIEELSKKVTQEDIDAFKGMEKIIIPGEGKPIGEFAEEIGDFFNDKKILFYRPTENEVIKLIEQAVGVDDTKKVLVFHPVEKAEFITLLEKYLGLGIVRKMKYEEIFVPKSITQTTAEIVLKSEYQFRAKLPVLDRIFRVPMPFIKNGELVFPKVGYDEELKSWMPKTAPVINESMTLEEAKAIFEKMYGEFCFKTKQDKDNAIALLMTPYCRGLYVSTTSRTPIGFYKANRERAGKDYCAGIVGIIHEGSAIQDAPISDGADSSDDELRKKLLSSFKMGRTRLHSSNNKGHIDSAILESIATSEYWEDRQLGSNSMLRFPNTLEISISANAGITYTPDLSARCVFVNLFFAEEDPNERQFTLPNLHEWVEQNKADVISAMYCLVKNWVGKGMPPGSKPFASFPEWARVVGGIMEAAGYSNPCEPNDDMVGIGGDSETRDMKRLFELCYEVWPNQWIVKKQVAEAIEMPDSQFNGLFSYLGWEKQGSSAKQRFATILGRFVNRQLSGIVLECIPSTNPTRNQYRWSKMADLRQKTDKQQNNLSPLLALEGFDNPPYRDNKKTIHYSKNTSIPTSPTNTSKKNPNKFDIYGSILNCLKVGEQPYAKLCYDLQAKGYEMTHIELELERMEREGEIFRPRPDVVKRVVA